MEDEELEAVETMTPAQVGKLLHMNAETVRAGIKQKVLPIGVAIQGKTGRWTFNIIKNKVLEYVRIKSLNNKEESR